MEVFSNIVLNLQAPAFATVFSPQGQTLSRSIQATLMDGATPWEIPETALCIIRYAKPDGTKGFYDTLEDDSSAYSYNGNVVTFGLATQALTVPGTVLMQLDFYNSDGEKLTTFTFRLIVAPGVFADSDIASEDFINVLTAKLTEAAQIFANGEAEAQQFFDENTAEAQQIFDQIKQVYGAPWTAATAAAMTDTSRVYVYTGTTTDTLTNGHWYYWDGTAWADGGVYNSTAFETDPTLTIAGAAADAKATGDAVEDLNRQLSDVEENQIPELKSALAYNIANTSHVLVDQTFDTSAGKTFYIKDMLFPAGSRVRISVPSWPDESLVLVVSYYRTATPGDTAAQEVRIRNGSNSAEVVAEEDYHRLTLYRSVNVELNVKVEFDNALTYLDQKIKLEFDNVPTYEEFDSLKGVLNSYGKVLPVFENASGTIVNFDSSANGMPVKSLIVDIATKQSGVGDPSPNNIRPISEWTSANVSITGINVWDEEWESGVYNLTTGEKEPNANTIRCKNLINIKPNTNYCWVNNITTQARIIFYDINKQYLSRILTTWTSPNVFITPPGAYYLAFYLQTTNYTGGFSLNYPATDTEYHPYIGTTIYVSFPTELGTVYGGVLDVTKKTLTVNRAMVDLGTLSWSKLSNNLFYWNVPVGTMAANPTIICSNYSVRGKAGSNSGIISAATERGIYIKYNTDVGNVVNIYDTDYEDAQSFGTAMSGVQLVYELASTQTYQLSIDDMENMTLRLGINNIWADAGNVDVTYPVDTNDYVKKRQRLFFWENNNNAPYWAFSLDIARKYFTVTNIKNIIELIADAGFNQMQLHFNENEGFRLALDNMKIVTGETTYDLAKCLGGKESPNLYYTQSDMDEIIDYAHMYGIDVVPSFDSPGHMGYILSVFPQFRYEDTSTLDITNPVAVEFGKSIVDLYSKYFASRKCKWFTIGIDEIAGNTGFEDFYANNQFVYVFNYVEKISNIIKSNWCVPRAFNEGFFYANDRKYLFSRDINVLYWRQKDSAHLNVADSGALIKLGYTVINSAYKYYWVDNNPNIQVSAETLRNADLLTDFQGTAPTKEGAGAMFCVWCDYKSNAPDNGDGGNAVVASITPLIAAFGEAIENAVS